ncbi:GIY-YIG catalytic domain-containing protein [Ureibacillus xyleni]|uniref:GIY-YIG catalytic domain-containing protein n=1 Tax=Ureibacillus xyleni TaxID=614648 RepID=A0A285SFW5_9BACL|nr:GIY-YIG nuclease family protein [Ureibacillus xyleni]SOC06479.1 GIY-YIG catalytic domain-containing protein [Ureibacillus xyleni]
MMRKEIEELLKKEGYYPLTTSLWNSFNFEQTRPNNCQEFENNINIIESHLQNQKGVYVYENASKEIVYIGKGKPIKKRIKSHYNKLLKEKDADNRDTFFINNQGTMKIYWKEIEEDDEREVIEHLLSYLVKPKYKKWRAI